MTELSRIPFESKDWGANERIVIDFVPHVGCCGMYCRETINIAEVLVVKIRL